ncbi:phosphatidylserine/phosphatidylglycerophosphate/cardiolipin synthase family protein [Sphingomonas sp. DBB INV C78]|uniref:phospholipase D-like domain-containing protein n=1 Tax=Sphingomonas sp. DBB INV C78 TaxID=3349434 RepID=UPI0036D2B7F5
MNEAAISADAGTEQSKGFLVAGNRLTLLTEGPERLEALIALIAGAQRSLRLLYYTYASDHAGAAVRDALLAALGRGVAVSIIIDGFGSHVDDAFFRPLEAGGAVLCRFIPRFGRRFLLRNHQKMVLADDVRVLIGGFNVQDDYFLPSTDPGGWRDLGLIMEGPGVRPLAGYFRALTRWARRPRPPMRDLRRALGRWSQSSGPVRWLLGGPTRRLNPWARRIKDDLRAASRLDMIAAYFIPNPAMLRRIGAVAKRGPARVVTAAKSDNLSTIAAARHTYHLLLKRGVEVYEFQPSKLHTKLIIVDDIVYIGSANFDMRSLYVNLEVMLRIEDRAFADHLRAYVDGECAQSEQVTEDAHRRAGGWLSRLRWGLAYYLLAVVDVRLTRRLNFGVGQD